MKRLSGLLSLLPLISVVTSQSTVPVFGQCGGEGFTGSTVCAAGSSCVVQNPFYSQCVPSSGAPAPTSTTGPTPTPSSSSAPSPTATVTGFVKTSGTKFTLNGKTFTAVGANSYWVGLMNYDEANMNQAFADIAATGATVVRTWGFNEVTSPDGVAFYQSWNGATPTINTGATGLENFDNVVALAKANGLRLIVALTNNWSDYGGMDVYVNQILGQGQPHDFFYTNPTVIAAYKNYVKTFVTRYLNEPGIFAWELANEPRCQGSTSATSGTCTVSTISTWAAEMSAFIKTIDTNHLVAIGDEGFINDPGNPIFVYNGASPSLGIDFAANLNISTLDFGTFHLYPESWGEPDNPFGTQWITDHATFMKQSNKPAILEEFGVLSNMSAVYTTWYQTVLSADLTGDLIWQAGSVISENANDGYMVFPGTDIYTLDTQHVAAIKARDGTA